ncbi:hypothetical protein AALO_G00208450 [Alosa alosa]|uniref:Uncharacterized protein n=1 Tax=Alosa alosa TaxID=278164 RepID=A0AAV6FZ60_9TELE|nr:hypothetical protein AALO_G00208450 [Alosa alosa]
MKQKERRPSVETSHLGSVDKQKDYIFLYCWTVQLEAVKMPLAQLADPWRKMALGSATSEDSHHVLEDSMGDDDTLSCNVS